MMICEQALESFVVTVRAEDPRAYLLQVRAHQQVLISSRLVVTATQQDNPRTMQLLIRRELVRALGEVGSRLDFAVPTRSSRPPANRSV